jgi:hypothetical protein
MIPYSLQNLLASYTDVVPGTPTQPAGSFVASGNGFEVTQDGTYHLSGWFQTSGPDVGAIRISVGAEQTIYPIDTRIEFSEHHVAEVGDLILAEAYGYQSVNPMALWGLNEGSGTTATDAVGGRTMTLTTGNWGTGLAENGCIQNDYMSTVTPALGLTGAWSVGFWMNANSYTSVKFQAIGSGTTTIDYWTGGGRFRVTWPGGGANNFAVGGGSTSSHFVITYDGGTSYNAYRDGVLEHSGTGTASTLDNLAFLQFKDAGCKVDLVKVYGAELSLPNVISEMGNLSPDAPGAETVTAGVISVVKVTPEA